MDNSVSASSSVGPQPQMLYQQSLTGSVPPPPSVTHTSAQQQSDHHHHHHHHHQQQQQQPFAHSYSRPDGLSTNHVPSSEQERQQQHQNRYYQHSRPEQATPVPSQPRSYSLDSGSSYSRGGQFGSDTQHRADLTTHGGMENHTHSVDHSGYHHASYTVTDPHSNGSAHSGNIPTTSSQEQQHNPLPSPAGPSFIVQPSPLYPAPASYTYGPSPTSQQQPAARRKNVRASQACNQCRQRKQKCDELRPCTFCRESGLGDRCHYKDVQAPKHDRTLLDMTSKLDSILDVMQNFEARLADIEKRLFRTSGEPQMATVTRSSSSTIGAIVTPAQSPVANDTVHLSDIFPDDFTDGDREREKKGGDHVLAIPPRHTTGAHKLLTYWHEVMNPLLKIQGTNELVVNSEDYAFEAEDARGLLRTYGVGEGHDDDDGTQASLANGNSSDVSSLNSRPYEGLWGATLTSGTDTDTKQHENAFNSGASTDEGLNVDEQTVRRLFQRFLTNIHILHPFLEERRVTILIDNFIRSYSPTGVADSFSTSASPGVSMPESASFSAPLKRKRSGEVTNGSVIAGIQGAGSSLGPRRPIERSVRNALVLLVLALGRITEVTTPLSGPIRDIELYAPSPVNGSFPPKATDMPFAASKRSPASPLFPVTRTRSPSSEASKTGSTSQQPLAAETSNHYEKDNMHKNVDRIPGLAYYAKATEILGNVHCGNDLPHVQAFLLAGLFMGQLGRVLESWSWINSACRACQYVVDKERDLLKSAKFNDEIQVKHEGEAADSECIIIRHVRKDLISLAYWTCLQLESDILAELNLPPSGISAYEDDVPLPAGVSLDNKSSKLPKRPEETPPEVVVLLYYSAQIQLRKILNRAHTVLYGRNDLSSQQTGWKAFDPRDLEWSLAEWRKTLPLVLAWDDSDPPSRNINAARMRAKYYGARYIINRPFLRYAVLQMTNQPTDFLSIEESPVEHKEFMDHGIFGSYTNGGGIHHPQDKQVEKQKILRAAKRCVGAAMKSTVAFDNIEGRLIVTNIWGTSHAQFGNMLVLAATYGSWLGRLVPTDKLVTLLKRTIHHLSPLCQLSPALSYDHQILANVLRNVQGTLAESPTKQESTLLETSSKSTQEY